MTNNLEQKNIDLQDKQENIEQSEDQKKKEELLALVVSELENSEESNDAALNYLANLQDISPSQELPETSQVIDFETQEVEHTIDHKVRSFLIEGMNEKEFNLFALQMIDLILKNSLSSNIVSLKDFKNQAKLYETSHQIDECMKLDKESAITVKSNDTKRVRNEKLHQMLKSNISDRAKETLLIFVLGEGFKDKLFNGDNIKGKLEDLQKQARYILSGYENGEKPVVESSDEDEDNQEKAA